jgi:sterol desaturase/sphingolipid hydroxylase (fatty acid hydroxylase superfamily)
MQKINNKGQAKIFNNKHLEYFTRTHPLVILGMYLPVIGLMLYYSSAIFKLSNLDIIATFIGGILLWTLFEYLMHRFAFHSTAQSRRSKRFLYIIHGNHHEYPRDKRRLFMPPLPSIILASGLLMVMYLITSLVGKGEFVFALFPGFLLGYLLYGSMHYAIHAYNPPYKWLKSLWRNHHLHHYKSEDRGFGVSTTLWDRLLGTMFVSDDGRLQKGKIRKMRF